MHNPFKRSDDNHGSFLPQDYVQRKSELRANVICLSLFGVVMFGIVAAFFVTNRQWLQVKRERQAITVQYTQQAARIEQLKNLENQKSEMMAKAEVTTALIEKVPRSVLINELVSRMPAETALLEMQLSSKRIREAVPTTTPTQARTGGTNQIRTLNNTSTTRTGAGTQRAGAQAPRPAERIAPPRFEFTLRLSGVAKTNENIADYLASLKACSLLEHVELKYIKPHTIDKHEFRHFEIECTLRRDVDARGIESIPEIRQAMDVKPAKTTEEKPGDDKAGEAVTTVPATKGGD